MVKAKRFNLSMALVVVLSVLLTLAISVGATLAWFSDTDFGTTDLTMSGAVLVNLADGTGDYSATTGDDVIFNSPAELLQPGMTITPEVYTLVQGSTTNALLRVKVEVETVWTDETAVPYGWEVDEEGEEEPTTYKTTIRWVGSAETGKTLEEVYTIIREKITNSFYDSIDASANAAGWYRHAGYYYFFGNGQEYSKNMTAIGVPGSAGEAPKNPTYSDGYGLEPTVDGENLALTNQLASVVNASASNIPFLVAPFEVPTSWGNEVAGAIITIDVTVQAMQDYVINLADTEGIREQQLPILQYAIPQFENAFYTGE